MLFGLSAFGKELLAINNAIKHIWRYIEVKYFHILLDHKTLIFTLRNRSPHQCGTAGLDFMSQFTKDKQHI